MAREFIDAVAMWARAFNYAAGEIQEEVLEDEDKAILTYVIYFASGFKVKALSSNPKNLRGMQGVVVIDEAAFHEYLAEVLKAALALTMWGAKVRLISTHNSADNLFNELILDSRAGKKRYSVHTITLDDACAEGLYQRICQVSKQVWTADKEAEWKENLLNDTATKEDAEEEYYCVPKNGSGLWLSRALIERQMRESTPVIRMTAKDGFNLVPEPTRYKEMQDWCEETLNPILATLDNTQLHFFGEDFARSGDMTSFVVLAQQQNLTKQVQFIVELGNMPYKQQEQTVLFILKRLPRFAGAAFDGRGNGGYLAESAQDAFGSLIESVQLSEKWYREHTAPFKAALEDGELEGIPKDADILADLRSFQVVKGVPRIPDIHCSRQLFDLFASINSDPLSLISWILLVSASIFGAFFFLWHYTTNKMKPDIEAINQLLRQNWNMKRWIDEELQIRKLRLWKRKCGVKDELKDYMESENNEQNK